MANPFLKDLYASLSPDEMYEPGQFRDISMPPISTPRQEKAKPLNPIVSEYLKKKMTPAVDAPAADILAAPAPPEAKQSFDYGEYSDDARKKLLAEQEGYDLRGNSAAALASLAAAFQGGNSVAASQGVLDSNQRADERKLAQFDKGRAGKVQEYDMNRKLTGDVRADAAYSRESDPNSQESKTAQMLAKKFAPGMDFVGMSATQLKEKIPSLEKLYSVDQQRLNREDARDERRMLFGMKAQEKQNERDEKKKVSLSEVENRRQNIMDNIGILDKMIGDKGTYEVMGSHNQDMDRLVDQIATDMAKLQDPDSVARPGEVELVKQGLVKSGFQNTNATARDLLKNFTTEVDRRAETAYKVRGIDSPQGARKVPAGASDADAQAAARQQRIAELRAKQLGMGMK